MRKKERFRKRDIFGVALSLGLVLGAYPLLTGLYVRDVFNSLKSLPRANFSKFPAIEYHPRVASPEEDEKIAFATILLTVGSGLFICIFLVEQIGYFTFNEKK